MNKKQYIFYISIIILFFITFLLNENHLEKWTKKIINFSLFIIPILFTNIMTSVRSFNISWIKNYPYREQYFKTLSQIQKFSYFGIAIPFLFIIFSNIFYLEEINLENLFFYRLVISILITQIIFSFYLMFLVVKEKSFLDKEELESIKFIEDKKITENLNEFKDM